MSDESATGTGSAGALMRAAREKQGLHIVALAAAIKVSPRKLEALEADRFDDLPDATFTRALAQTVCRQLKIDARPVLELLPPAGRVELETRPGGLNAPFRDRPGREDPGPALGALRPLVLGAVLLVVAAAAVYFFPAEWLGSHMSSTPAALPVPASSAAPLVAVAAAPAVDPAASAPAAEPPASAPTSETVFSAPPVSAAASENGAPAGLVQLRSSDASWVEARDGRGQVLLYRMVLPGESVGLDGALPIRLTIGNAAAMQVGFRGKQVDLTPSTRDNVARVELQ
ncbi:MAG: helix-turn-helix domain-containing protein [Rubrivivax sp.]|nr:helix-turn-helix domain-containing protein [Rubrivivax sp.]